MHVALLPLTIIMMTYFYFYANTLLEGYYCPGGSSIATDIICPIGKYCPEGSAEPQDCPPASYVDYRGAWECTTCPERKLFLFNL